MDHRTPPAPARLAPVNSDTAYGRAALHAEADAVECAPHGLRHRTIFAAACACGELLAGGELADRGAVEAFLVAAALSALPDDPAGARRAVRRGLDRGAAKPRTAPDTQGLSSRGEAVAAVCGWWERVQAGVPADRRTPNTLRIAAAFALQACAAGRVDVSASYRQIAEAAGVSVGTVAGHLPRLDPFLRVVEAGSRQTGVPTVWRLRTDLNSPPPPGEESGLFKVVHPPALRLPRPDLDPLDAPNHDAWTGWPNGWRVYLALDAVEPRSVAGLADALDLHPRTIRRALHRIAALGAATCDGDGGWRLAADRRVDNPGDALRRRRERHEADRVRWRHWRHRLLHSRDFARDPPENVDPRTGEIDPAGTDRQREARREQAA